MYDVLDMYPEVNMSKIKEINYFSSEKKINKGLKHYLSYFREPNSKHTITGEESPDYMNIPKKIKEDPGDIKMVMIL